MWFLIGRGLLYISYLRQKKGNDRKCLGMCVMILHREGPWLTAKLKDQGWDYLHKLNHLL